MNVTAQGTTVLSRMVGDALTTAENLGSAWTSRNSHTTFCSYCCFMDRKCWSHCLFTSSSCGERVGLVGNISRGPQTANSMHTSFPKSAQCVRTLATDTASTSRFSIKLSAPQRESLYQPPHFILARTASLTLRYKNSV